MYADRVEADSKRPLKDRLNGSSLDAPSRRRPITGKRQRDDDKWEHDLFDTDRSQLSTHKGGVRDLRLKLQKKGLQSTATQSGAPASSMRDLREKLSGVVTAPPASGGGSKPKPASEASRPVRRSTAVEAPIETKSTNPSHKKKTQQNADDVEGFLESLGLDKYTITFQAEEVDMTALAHMTDEDLKAMGIPMGPRKKILLALESRG